MFLFESWFPWRWNRQSGWSSWSLRGVRWFLRHNCNSGLPIRFRRHLLTLGLLRLRWNVPPVHRILPGSGNVPCISACTWIHCQSFLRKNPWRIQCSVHPARPWCLPGQVCSGPSFPGLTRFVYCTWLPYSGLPRRLRYAVSVGQYWYWCSL